jgi:hypothetical protein
MEDLAKFRPVQRCVVRTAALKEAEQDKIKKMTRRIEWQFRIMSRTSYDYPCIRLAFAYFFSALRKSKVTVRAKPPAIKQH